ncbi:MAG: hypothetical protein DRR08_24575 [Candidatus Parabeggiatoa sp. nov. 2]|nr:MAG: hypothetical protein DRR08_24575 [Gammaproteobacteria bacterium]
MFLEAIEYCNGNVAQAAKELGIGKTTIYKKLREWQIPIKRTIIITNFCDQKFGKASKLEFLEIRCLKDIGFLAKIFQKRIIIPEIVLFSQNGNSRPPVKSGLIPENTTTYKINCHWHKNRI